MKSLLALIVIVRSLYYIQFQIIEEEKFMYFKSIAYLFISSIHSLILSIPIPLGALIMLCFTLFDHKNIRIKLRMIGAGLVIIFLSLIDFQHLSYPFQQAYLYMNTQSVQKIDIYSYNDTHESYLFSITESEKINSITQQIRLSTPHSSWNHKKIGSNLGYRLIVHHNNKTIPMTISPYDTGLSNLFIGNNFIPYKNDTLIPYIHSIYSNSPSILTINTSKNTSINISNKSILDNLWRIILWSESTTVPTLSKDDFQVPSYLFFEGYLGFKLLFTLDFNYAIIDNQKIIELPIYLQTMLNEQYILSQLDYVNELTYFEPAHVSNPQNSSLKFSIQLDPNQMYYGLYLQDYKTNETILLHSVNSPHAQYFVLKHPYILLLDEKSPNAHYLMLVNQNIPEKHRYIVKNEQVIPRSISLCPQNTQFTYIIDYGDTSTLYLVTDYYRSPKVLATGQITDSLFLSDNYLVFTQIIDGKSILSVYSLTHRQIIKYINIPGDITLIEASNNKINFVVQSIEGLSLKESTFCIDNNLNIYKLKKP